MNPMKKLYAKYLPKIIGNYFNALALVSPRKAAMAAVKVFSTPRKGRVQEAQADYLEKAKYQVFETQGHQLQAYEWPGKGPKVLLLHGWESNSFRWRNLIAELQRKNYHILAIDAPAHGHSSGVTLNVPLYAACAHDIINLEKPDFVIGHSMGGMSTLYYQYKYQNQGLKKIVSLGSPSELKEIMAHYQAMLGFNQRVLRAQDDYFLERFGFRIDDFSTTEFSKDITLPCLLVHDEDDRIAPFHSAERMLANLPNGQLIRTKGLGHSLHQKEVNQQIVAYLNS
jgi:pimeloyl-ACP methyl ester carboxylesterase